VTLNGRLRSGPGDKSMVKKAMGAIRTAIEEPTQSQLNSPCGPATSATGLTARSGSAYVYHPLVLAVNRRVPVSQMSAKSLYGSWYSE
jgi:hypothetical protein